MPLLPMEFILRNIVADKERALSALVGTALAVTLIAAATISVDVAEENVFLLAVNDTAADLVVWAPYGNRTYEQEILTIPYVESVIPLIRVGEAFEISLARGRNLGYNGILGTDRRLRGIARQLGITYNESLDLGPNEFLISRHFLDGLSHFTDLSAETPEVGQSVPIRFRGVEEGRWHNLTYVGSFEQDWYAFRSALGYIMHCDFIVGLQTALELMAELGPGHGSVVHTFSGGVGGIELPLNAAYCLVRVDRSSYLDPRSLENTLRNLGKITSRAEKESGVQMKSYAPLEPRSEYYQSRLSQTRTMYILASLPILLLGTYLGSVGMGLSQMGRRREVGLLKCRGFTNRQVSGMFLAESILLGCTGGVVGVAVGLLAASTLRIRGLEELSTLAGLDPSLFLTGAIIGAGMMFAASFRSVRKLGGFETTELLWGYSPELSRDVYRPRLDLALVLVPLAIYSAIQLSPSGVSLRAGMFINAVASALMAAGTMILPFTPIMMSLGLTRLLSRGTTKTYSALSRLLAPMVGGMRSLLETSVIRNQRRNMSISLLLALSVALGSFVAILPATEEMKAKRALTFIAGSDIAVRLPGDTDPALLQKISTLEGVSATSILETVGDSYRTFIMLDPKTYRHCVEGNPFFTGRIEDALDILGKSDVAVPSRKYLKSRHETWSFIVLGLGENSLQLTLSGSFDNLPGVQSTLYADNDRYYFLVRRELAERVRLALESGTSGTSNTESQIYCLVKALPGADRQDLVEAIASLEPGLVVTSGTTAEEAGEGDLVSFARIQFVLAMSMACLGIGAVAWVGFRERRHEIAQEAARGMTRGQIACLLTGEVFVMAFLGLSVGLVGGLLPTYAYILTMARRTALTIPVAFAVPWFVVVLPALAFLALCLVPLVWIADSRRLRMHEALRIGH